MTAASLFIRLTSHRHTQWRRLLSSSTNGSPTAKSNTADAKKNVLNAIKPRKIQPLDDSYTDIGQSFSGRKIEEIRSPMLDKINDFYQYKPIREMAKAKNIDENIFTQAFISFRRYCYMSESLPPELHIKICDIIDNRAHVSDLFPFFLSHSREAFPHIECQEELKKISNLGLPHSWYPIAREKQRRIICHLGPTNSGKTYNSMKRFLESKSGIYCGPLKLLANEIYEKTNSHNVPCDLVTGDDRRYANKSGEPSPHISCTVEMTPINERVEVAIIDEIQMLRDPSRGWAWTRALLGIPADEVHICGEEAALDLIKWVLMPTGDTIEVARHKRLTPLEIQDEALGSLANVEPGDCIVCFSKEHIYKTSCKLDELGKKNAVVYGTLSPQAKLSQCQRFNTFEDDCKYLVATDAIGMGLNLSIRRVIFKDLHKITADERGVKSRELISTSQCLQIAGRAGRYNKGSEKGLVTTLLEKDLPVLKRIMAQPVPPIIRAGLHPTSDQIELFAYHLPHLGLSELIDLFIDLCEYDVSGYFICDMEVFKILADTIQHIDITLKDRFVFCCAPINVKQTYLVTMFTKMARQFSENNPITCEWMCRQLNMPLPPPKTLSDLAHLETVYDVLETYLWLSYRFPANFIQPDEIRHVQNELDAIIYQGIQQIPSLSRLKLRQLQSERYMGKNITK